MEKVYEDWNRRRGQGAAEKQAAEDAWMKRPGKDTVGTFETHLRDLYIKNFSNVEKEVLTQKGATVEKYCKALAQMLEQQVAVPLVTQLDEIKGKAERDAFLEKHQGAYIRLVKNLQNFVTDKINTDRVQEVLETGYANSPHRLALKQEKEQLAATGLDEYQKFNPKKEAGKEEPKPDQQLQQQNPEQQVQPAAPAMMP